MSKTLSLVLFQSQVDSAVENNPGGCIVSPGGGVNCTNAVYEDHRTWKSSRKSIDERIRQLKLELDTLKVILKVHFVFTVLRNVIKTNHRQLVLILCKSCVY